MPPKQRAKLHIFNKSANLSRLFYLKNLVNLSLRIKFAALPLYLPPLAATFSLSPSATTV